MSSPPPTPDPSTYDSPTSPSTPSISPVQIIVIALVIGAVISICIGTSCFCSRRRRKSQEQCTTILPVTTRNDWMRLHTPVYAHEDSSPPGLANIGVVSNQSTTTRQTPTRPPRRGWSPLGSLRRAGSVRSVDDPPPRYEQAQHDAVVSPNREPIRGLGLALSTDSITEEAGRGTMGLAVTIPSPTLSRIEERSAEARSAISPRSPRSAVSPRSAMSMATSPGLPADQGLGLAF
ncbi:hypothetical protein BT63DRAFT_291104 [Microthyrium microscopicum]|uniref:Transmembrane protein n=1 Tax=Microthyrium microscopicum TaxID=703497 RepID=A0A6A6U7H6_9PEZI|nr:hypothetical protein BT63DRAFT_291104 [Microthyrium microscopicum]